MNILLLFCLLGFFFCAVSVVRIQEEDPGLIILNRVVMILLLFAFCLTVMGIITSP